MIGLLWLKLLNKDIDPLTKNTFTLEQMYPQVQEFKKTIKNVNNSQLIEMLLDLENNPNLLLDNVILEFDQWIIIVIKKQEELVSSGVTNQDMGPGNGGDEMGTGAFAEMNQRTEEEIEETEGGEGHGQQSEIIKKNLSNNLTRSKAGIVMFFFLLWFGVFGEKVFVMLNKL
jgi:urease accessory protein UreE